MSAFHLRKRNLTRYLPQSNRILNLGTAFTFLTAFQLYAGTSYSQTTTPVSYTHLTLPTKA